MNPGPSSELVRRENQFTASDVEAILRERGWLAVEPNSDIASWTATAAELLGPHAESREALADLLGLVFRYDAAALLATAESHRILAREGAREVIRELAHRILDGGDVDSDRYKEIISALKETLPHRGRELFYPIRLALAGRAGEGQLDRVILLLDAAAKLPFAVAAKSARQRMLGFCSALD
jgi:hypothetical protein